MVRLKGLEPQGTFSEVRLGVNVKTGNTAAIKVVDRGAFEKFQALRNSRLSLVHEAELLVSRSPRVGCKICMTGDQWIADPAAI